MIRNNNIPRIKGIIERLSKTYGQEIEWNGEKYYTFPTPEELKDVTLVFRGSQNQRIIDVQESRNQGTVVLKDF